MRKRMTLEDLYIQFCQKNGTKLFDFGPFIVEFLDGSKKVNILSKPSLIKAVESVNQDIEEEELWQK